MTRLALLVTVAGLLVAAHPAAADCGYMVMPPKVLTPASTAIGDHGGVVVSHASHDRAPGEPWTFQVGATTARHTVVTIVAGLEVYVPQVKAAHVALQEGKTRLVEVSTDGPTPAPLAAPSIKRVTSESTHGRHHSDTVYAELVGDPPGTAVALVVFDRAGAARSSGEVTAHAKQVEVFSASDCGGFIAGTVMSSPGDQVQLAWLDSAGGLSKKTELLRVSRM